MKKGRKKAPIAVAKAKGYYRPSRHKSDIDESGQLDYITLDNIPEPPESLSDKEREQWTTTLTETSKFDGWIAKTDLPLFEMWCIQKVHLNDLNKEIKRHNEVNSDVRKLLIKERETCLKTFRSLCSEFGFSPSSKTGIPSRTKPTRTEAKDKYVL